MAEIAFEAKLTDGTVITFIRDVTPERWRHLQAEHEANRPSSRQEWERLHLNSFRQEE